MPNQQIPFLIGWLILMFFVFVPIGQEIAYSIVIGIGVMSASFVAFLWQFTIVKCTLAALIIGVMLFAQP